MTIEDLIKHHETGAQACRAYADTPNASDPKTKDIAKHYERRALWHEDAIKLLEGMRATSMPVMFQCVPAGQEPDPDKWEAFGHATIKPIPATEP